MTDITIIMDRSGSMATVATETVSGYNAFVKEQGADAVVSLVQFDQHAGGLALETVHDRVPTRKAVLRQNQFRPRGNTPLLDAVGSVVTALKERKPKGKVIVAIVTDGYENASRDWTRRRVRDLIDTLRGKKWQFVFMGAGIDAYHEAASVGITQDSTYAYANTGIGTRSAWGNLSHATADYSAGRTSNVTLPDFDTSDPSYEPPKA